MLYWTCRVRTLSPWHGANSVTSHRSRNNPESAPHSVVMFAMVKRSSMERLLIVSSGPVNSIAWFRTSSLPNNAHSATMISFPWTPSWRRPWKWTLATGGIKNHVFVVDQIAAASVRTTGVPKQPTPPYMFEWLSLATASVPGHA